MTNVFLEEPNRVRTYLHYYRVKLQKKQIEVCNLVEYVYHFIVSNDAWLTRTRLVSALPSNRPGIGIGLRPNACWYTSNEATVIEVLEKGIGGDDILSLWVHEEPLNPFLSPRDWERENKQYFDSMRQTWEADFQRIITNEIDLVLDLYNNHIKLYQLTGEPVYARSAQSLLEELEKPCRR
jgi:hypothetical protein